MRQSGTSVWNRTETAREGDGEQDKRRFSIAPYAGPRCVAFSLSRPEGNH
jgi:hypothetical protein